MAVLALVNVVLKVDVEVVAAASAVVAEAVASVAVVASAVVAKAIL